jgi:hypothetical protein
MFCVCSLLSALDPEGFAPLAIVDRNSHCALRELLIREHAFTQVGLAGELGVGFPSFFMWLAFAVAYFVRLRAALVFENVLVIIVFRVDVLVTLPLGCRSSPDMVLCRSASDSVRVHLVRPRAVENLVSFAGTLALAFAQFAFAADLLARQLRVGRLRRLHPCN